MTQHEPFRVQRSCAKQMYQVQEPEARGFRKREEGQRWTSIMARRMPARLVRNVMPVTVPVVGFWPCQAFMKSSGRMGAVRASTQYPLSLTIGGVAYVCMLVCVLVCRTKVLPPLKKGNTVSPCESASIAVNRHKSLQILTYIAITTTALFFNHLYSSIVSM